MAHNASRRVILLFYPKGATIGLAYLVRNVLVAGPVVHALHVSYDFTN